MIKIKKLSNIILLSTTLLFTACSVKEPIIKVEKSDLKNTTKYANNNFIDQNQETNKYLKRYFTPWEQNKVTYSKEEATWGFSYKNKTVYLENHRLASQTWFEKQIENSNFDSYNTLLKKAITLKNSDVRVFPTSSPMFYNPSKAGEGFPFDYNQNSAIKINTPIFLSHYSKDRAWVYMQSSTVGGWIKTSDIAFVNETFIQNFKTGSYSVAIKEKFPIYDNSFREYVKLATIFPKFEDKYIIAKKDFQNNAIIAYINLSSQSVQNMPIKFNSKNRIKIAQALLDEPYGWGGLLNNRDCSSFTQDFFVPFGKFISRNSRAQTKNGKYHDISTFSKKEKKEYIKQNGVPFSTLIYLKGHIMLYVGVKNNEPLAMHNMWSVRLKNKFGEKYRHIVGKASITTLEPGKNLKDFDEENNVLRQILGIVVL
ncbi:SH3 domain-containing protein [Poseidonibacter lekithochrous]|uniref:C40 family peptidase n=1 Tax=Poseidonibacter TaxID=2321187 RepID=UPI001C0A3835|nr:MULTISPECIES: SH3 domain-containing C40 family peptidase [Poseidonibacter]MBU3013558.1 SH3 domain-containing protein [Poseidonibacter lekithochrous]MDO6826855.1 SH3 domain-containing protein [Poseidonibacter sp. 1_MG-2023]